MVLRVDAEQLAVHGRRPIAAGGDALQHVGLLWRRVSDDADRAGDDAGGAAVGLGARRVHLLVDRGGRNRNGDRSGTARRRGGRSAAEAEGAGDSRFELLQPASAQGMAAMATKVTAAVQSDRFTAAPRPTGSGRRRHETPDNTGSFQNGGRNCGAGRTRQRESRLASIAPGSLVAFGRAARHLIPPPLYPHSPASKARSARVRSPRSGGSPDPPDERFAGK